MSGGDNFHFDITGAPLALSLEVATSKWKNVVGWSVDNDGRRLVLYWTACEQSTPLPAPLSDAALEAFVKAWLDGVDYGTEPDHDGHNGRGWRVYVDRWAQVGYVWQTSLAVEPAWIMYGK